APRGSSDLRAPMQPSYGYGLYLPNVIRDYLSSRGGVTQDAINREIRNLSPHFYAARWELCRRGILRPGIREYGQQATEDGASGNGTRSRPSESSGSPSQPADPASLAASRG